MATSYTSNKKIGALDSASTPLAAANEIVLNQNGDIVKAALSDVEAKVFDAKTAKTTVDGTEVVVVRQTDNTLRQVPLDNIVKAGLITNAMVSNSAAIADSKLDTINTAGKVTNTAVQAVSTNTANRIVTRDGSGNFAAGTVTATLSGNATTATNLSSNRTFALTGDVTGSVSSNLSSGASIATAIAAGAIVNADINAAAAIADSKLAQITSTNKVANSATTATSANTANAIVARDGSKNFSAGTITATLSGNATTATTLATGRTIALTGDVTGTTGSFNGSANVSAATTIANNAITAAKLANGAVTGAAGGGKLAASAITSQTQLSGSIASGDQFLVHDASASALRRVAWSELQPAGSVLQVVASSQNLSGTKQSATVADSGLAIVSITRKQSNSKLLLHMSGGRWQCNGNIANTYFYVSQNGGGYANIVTLGNNTVENVESYAGTTIGTHVASYMFTPAANITTVALKIYYLTSGAAQWHLANSTPFFISITEISA